MTSRQGERFQSVSNRYAQFRPRYPDTIVEMVAGRLASAPVPFDCPVLEVGSGTGIFTRQLAAALPARSSIVGIEPSSEMRARAASSPSPPSVAYRDGTAEHLPIADGGARGVLAATAAHWFDRTAFYREAGRALRSGGILAIVEYVRDEGFAAARAMLDFLDQHGEARAYARPDYVAEMGALAGFGALETARQAVTVFLSLEEFAGLTLSSSHARKAVETLGQEHANARLEAIGAALADDDGKVPFGYVFQAFLTRRA